MLSNGIRYLHLGTKGQNLEANRAERRTPTGWAHHCQSVEPSRSFSQSHQAHRDVQRVIRGRFGLPNGRGAVARIGPLARAQSLSWAAALERSRWHDSRYTAGPRVAGRQAMTH